jgi:predicted TIM-barrel fold metal-dependent hydrolase
VRSINSLLQDKVLSGSDCPLLTPDRWLRDFETLDIKPGIRPKVLRQNAVRLLRLDG